MIDSDDDDMSDSLPTKVSLKVQKNLSDDESSDYSDSETYKEKHDESSTKTDSDIEVSLMAITLNESYEKSTELYPSLHDIPTSVLPKLCSPTCVE